MNTVFPLSFPDINFASIKLLNNCFTVILVPLHNLGQSKFLRKIIGDAIFNLKQCKGIPGTFNEFKNSVGRVTLSWVSTIEPIDLYIFSSPGILF